MGRRGFLDDLNEEDCNASKRADKMDLVIVDPSKRDRCLTRKGPSLVERCWIMTRPPGELLMEKKLVTARKLLAVRDQINCWSGEYNNQPVPPSPTQMRGSLDTPISNCEGRRTKFQNPCLVHAVDNCNNKKSKRDPCAWMP